MLLSVHCCWYHFVNEWRIVFGRGLLDKSFVSFLYSLQLSRLKPLFILFCV